MPLPQRARLRNWSGKAHLLLRCKRTLPCFAVTNNFYWNFRWTFKGQAAFRSRRNKYFRFLAVSVLNLGINLLLLRLFVETLSMDKTLAQLVSIGLVSILNFLMNSRFTFGEKAADSDDMNGREA